MVEIVARMKASEQNSGVYPTGAGPATRKQFLEAATEHPARMSGEVIPWKPAEARAYWAEWEARHQPPEDLSLRPHGYMGSIRKEECKL